MGKGDWSPFGMFMGMGALSWTSLLFLFVIPFLIPLFLNCILYI